MRNIIWVWSGIVHTALLRASHGFHILYRYPETVAQSLLPFALLPVVSDLTQWTNRVPSYSIVFRATVFGTFQYCCKLVQFFSNMSLTKCSVSVSLILSRWAVDSKTMLVLVLCLCLYATVGLKFIQRNHFGWYADLFLCFSRLQAGAVQFC